MALCEGQLDSVLQINGEKVQMEKKMEANGDLYGLDNVPPMPLSVDYRSPVSHFVPPAVELYANRHKPEIHVASSASETTPPKRKRGRPRVDKTSPEYLANLAARKQAREMAAVMGESGEKRKRGRPRVDKTAPEYLARKRAREIALEKKAKKEYRRRTTGDSAASSSAGESTPRVKRKYTKRAPGTKKESSSNPERVKGKRGRPRKNDPKQQGKIRVRNNLMPSNEPITLDSDDEPDLGSPSQASDSLSMDENLRALRHIHEKYANIHKDDLYEAHLLAANFKQPDARGDDDVLSVASSDGSASVKELGTRVEKLEDSSNSESGSSSSESDSSSSSSSSSSDSSHSSDSSDSEEDEKPNSSVHDDRSFGAWSHTPESDSDPERGAPVARTDDDISESDNESADKSFPCRVCGKWYSTRVTLKIHARVHQNKGGGGSRSRARSSDRYECDCCSETFSRREKLWEHKAEAHRGAMTVRCEVCRRCFEDDNELAAHATTHTSDDRIGRCSDCGSSFARYDQLRRHRASVHGSAPARLPHACVQCGKRFSHAHSLTRHAHNHAKQLYRCVVCKASFARADQLAQHLNSHLATYKRMKQ
ncbi:zinc finger protein 37-like isoform X2 [Danaus plexippus]|uniref:zinc finger protein 37-like isoform X2 n=1 Tax=Danaus plexippus TaxID=13037 RepID=UPI002AB09C7C|nr:zinc finger protein 37-like isoform X2 [Danaus plexippus]